MAWAPESLAGQSGPAGPAGPASPADRGADSRHPPPDRDLRGMAEATVLEVLRHLDSGPRGLTETQADERLLRYGENTIPGQRPASWPRRFARSLRDPFTAVLLCLGVISTLVASWGTACVITVLVLVSSALRSRAEYQADRSAAGLRERVATTTTVQRKPRPGALPYPREIPVALLVPGDVIRLGPGDVVPADVLLLRSGCLTVRQSAHTGESAPVVKDAVGARPTAPDASLFDRPHLCFQGSSVESGSGTAIVVATGARTEFSRDYRGQGPVRRPESAFDRAVNGISWTLIRFMLLTPPLVLIANAALRGRGLETLPFAVAVAVGLTPEMLPVIVTTVLARHAAALARDHAVIVRWLPALHNLGAIDVLCTDKTGTLTQDRPRFEQSLAPDGRPDPGVLHWAAANSLWTLELADLLAPDPLDEAILDSAGAWGGSPLDACAGVAALPFEPVRRLATAVIRRPDRPGLHTLIVKGAVEDVLGRCTRLRGAGPEISPGIGLGIGPDTAGPADPGTGPKGQDTGNPATVAPATAQDRDLQHADRTHLLALATAKAEEGLRLLAVATAERPARLGPYSPADEHGLTFTGFIALRDALAPTAAAALAELAQRDVAVKVVTGDHPGTAARVCRDLGFDPGTVVDAHRIDVLTDRALAELARRTTVFARCTPQHKARIVRTLRAGGQVTGFLGDGVNDLAALHAADVGICPSDAVDVTREAADVVLAAKDLTAIDHAITAGRHSTGIIGTYLRVALSSNLGNVIAMLAAGLLLPFLPMLPVQVLLQNLCFDAAQLAFTADRPAPADLRRPLRLRSGNLLRSITTFGLVNAGADLTTFTVLALIAPASIHSSGQAVFHAGWFTENLLTQALVLLLLRPGRSDRRHRAGTAIRVAAAALAAAGLLLPWSPPAHRLGMTAPPLGYYLLLSAVLVVYGLGLTAAKARYERRHAGPGTGPGPGTLSAVPPPGLRGRA